MYKITWKRTATAVLAAAMLLTPAYAAETDDENQNPQPKEVGEEIRDQLPEQKAVDVPYITLEAYVREHNPMIQSFALTLKTLKKTDPTKKISQLQDDLDDQRDQLERQRRDAKDGIAQLTPVVRQFEQLLGAEEYAGDPALKASVLSLQLNLQSLQGSVDMMDEVLELLDDISEELDDARKTLKDAKKELYQTAEMEMEAAGDMIVFCAQNCHVALSALHDSREALEREISAAERRLAVAEMQGELGMLSPITLNQLKNTYNSLTFVQDTLALQEESLAGVLAQLCGYDADTTVQAVELPQVTTEQLENMNWESDLKAAVENSYSVWNYNNAMRQAKNAYQEDVLGSDDAAKGAEINRDAAVQAVERTLRQLYQSVSLNCRQLELAQQALVQEQQSFAVSEAKYQMGMISELQLLDAQNMLTSKENNVHTAEIQLLAAYNRYSWAKRGIA